MHRETIAMLEVPGVLSVCVHISRRKSRPACKNGRLLYHLNCNRFLFLLGPWSKEIALVQRNPVKRQPLTITPEYQFVGTAGNVVLPKRAPLVLRKK